MTTFTIVFLLALFLGMPVAFALGVPSLMYLVESGQTSILPMMPQKIFGGLNSFTLLAVPYFIFAGEIMSKAGITERLANLFYLLVGRVKGGLAYVNILNSTVFAGISGSAITDIMAMGSLEINMMVEQGYEKDFATACTVSSSVVGPIIPPSIMAAMYSGITGVSLGALFAGGYLPGILFSLSMAIIIFLQAKKRNYPRRMEKIPFKAAVKIVIDGIVAILMPVIMIGGILGGVFTPTEAAIVGVVYAIIAGFFILRTLKLSDFPEMIVNTIKNASGLLLLMGIAYLFGWVLSFENVSGNVADLITSYITNPTIFMLLVVLLALFAGMWMEVGTIVILFTPILYPTAVMLGVHPIVFGVILIITSALGVTTPPVGVCLYAASSIAGIPIERTFRRVAPFFIAQFCAVVLMVLFPDIILFLPRVFGLI
jgi:tripartite ATP-independent transporter DctM subunit